MKAEHGQTVWFPKDSVLGIVLMIPIWGIAGLGWGLFMSIWTGESLIGWLFVGMLWGATMWGVFSVLLAIACRERSISIPLKDPAGLSERLGEAIQSMPYTVEQQSPTYFVCQTKGLLTRFLSFEYTKLHVELLDDGVRLTGPVFVVNRVRKKLLAAG